MLKKSAAVVLGLFCAVREIAKANVSGLYERLPDGQSGPQAQDHAFISTLLADRLYDEHLRELRREGLIR